MNRPTNDPDRAERGASLLDQTLATASQDKQTVTPEGKTISGLVECARIRNVPTQPYNHANPDKLRLSIDTPLIPHSFGTARGW